MLVLLCKAVSYPAPSATSALAVRTLLRSSRRLLTHPASHADRLVDSRRFSRFRVSPWHSQLSHLFQIEIVAEIRCQAPQHVMSYLESLLPITPCFPRLPLPTPDIVPFISPSGRYSSGKLIPLCGNVPSYPLLSPNNYRTCSTYREPSKRFYLDRYTALTRNFNRR